MVVLRRLLKLGVEPVSAGVDKRLFVDGCVGSVISLENCGVEPPVFLFGGVPAVELGLLKFCLFPVGLLGVRGPSFEDSISVTFSKGADEVPVVGIPVKRLLGFPGAFVENLFPPAPNVVELGTAAVLPEAGKIGKMLLFEECSETNGEPPTCWVVGNVGASLDPAEDGETPGVDTERRPDVGCGPIVLGRLKLMTSKDPEGIGVFLLPKLDKAVGACVLGSLVV